MSAVARRQYRKRARDEENAENQERAESLDSEQADTLRDALELRRLRRKQHGVDAQDLLKGDPGDLDARRRREEGQKKVEDAALTEGFSKSSSTAMDPSKHLEKYLETELRKRQLASGEGGAPAEDTSPTSPVFADPTDALYHVPDNLKVDSKPVEEGNVTLSTSMLTAIPEIDLGIDAKLKNIEQTEKAKRKLIEDRGKKHNPEAFVGSSQAAADRFLRPGRGPVSDVDPNNVFGRREDPEAERRKRAAKDRREGLSTDDAAVERFKKRQPRRF